MERKTGFLANFAICALALYKAAISPFLPPCCRFTPTCSEYAAEAIRTHGVFCGSLLAFFRLMRCNPFCRAGYDPVPQKFGLRIFHEGNLQKGKNVQ